MGRMCAGLSSRTYDPSAKDAPRAQARRLVGNDDVSDVRLVSSPNPHPSSTPHPHPSSSPDPRPNSASNAHPTRILALAISVLVSLAICLPATGLGTIASWAEETEGTSGSSASAATDSGASDATDSSASDATGFAATQGDVARTADYGTWETYPEQLLGGPNGLNADGTRYAGRIWSDKSVVANAQDQAAIDLSSQWDGYSGEVSTEADFLHVFSALGSSQVVKERYAIPLDITLVLDTSNSMRGAKIANTIEGLNNAIKVIAENPNNRVSLVTFNRQAYTEFTLISPYYNQDNDDDPNNFRATVTGFDENGDPTDSPIGSNVVNYQLSYSGQAQRVNEYTGAYDPTAWENVDELFDPDAADGDPTTSTYASKSPRVSGTNIQSGIALGCEQMVANSEVTQYTSPDTGEVYDRVPVIIVLSDGAANNVCAPDYEFYDPTVNPYWDKDGDGHYTHGDDKNWGSKGETETEGWGNVVSTILTGDYFSLVVKDHYGSYPKVYTIGLSPNIATLNPGAQFNEESGNGYEDYLTWLADPGQAHSFVYQPVKDGQPSGDPQTWEIPAYPGSVAIKNDALGIDISANVGFDEFVSNIDYVSGGFQAVSTTGLSDVFRDIVTSASSSLFNPVSGTNDVGAEDGLTYADPLGYYMEAKDVEGLLLFDQMYDVTRSVEYSYAFNLAYSQNHGGGFGAGWYYGDDPAARNIYSETLPDGFSTEQEAWEAGWAYRMPYSAFYSEYGNRIAGLPAPGEDETLKYEMTEYVVYEISGVMRDGSVAPLGPEELDAWQMNPSYEFTTESAGPDESSAPGPDVSGSYRLSDFVVWTENTGDYDDNDYPFGGSHILDGNYDDAIYINIPSDGLPLQVAYIDNTAQDATSTVETNVGQNGAFPMRLFYSVGIDDEYLDPESGEIYEDLIDPDYLANNETDDGDVVFYSNYYTPTPASSIGGSLSSPSTIGNPVMSFSPGVTNRYYTFRKNLPLYQLVGYEGNDRPPSQVLEDYDVSYGSIEVNGSECPVVNQAYTSDQDTAEAGTLTSDGWYYIVLDFYTGAGERQHLAIARQGREFGSGYDNVDYGAYVTWFNTYTHQVVSMGSYVNGEWTVNTENPNSGDHPDEWVVATKVGGLRTGEMEINAVMKAKGANRTNTADYSYFPAVSASTTANTQTADAIINTYLGNNGLLTLGLTADEPPADEPPGTEPPGDEPPSDEPPGTEPPSDEPPADEPSGNEPPAGGSSTTQPGSPDSPSEGAASMPGDGPTQADEDGASSDALNPTGDDTMAWVLGAVALLASIIAATSQALNRRMSAHSASAYGKTRE